MQWHSIGRNTGDDPQTGRDSQLFEQLGRSLGQIEALPRFARRVREEDHALGRTDAQCSPGTLAITRLEAIRIHAVGNNVSAAAFSLARQRTAHFLRLADEGLRM